jgi:cob(I)alamin adenosyltransferase
MFYTKKGDGGTTQLYGKKEYFSKASPIVEALGALDECNSYVGFCRTELQEKDIRKDINLYTLLHDVQNTLFIVQAELAGAKKRVAKEKIQEIERIINKIEKSIPKIQNFTVPGSTHIGAMFDVARTLVRKAERRVVYVRDADLVDLHINTLTYLNRLSSLFFALARYTENLENLSRDTPTYS